MNLQTFQPGQQVGFRPPFTCGSRNQCCADTVQCIRQTTAVGGGVESGGVQTGMTQELAYSVQITRGTEQCYRRGVPDCVWSDMLFGQNGQILRCLSAMPLQHMTNAGSGDRRASLAQKETGIIITAIPHRYFNSCDRPLPQWNRPPLSAFSQDPHMGERPWLDLLVEHAGQFADSASCVEHEQQYGIVAPTFNRAEVRRGDDSLHFVGLKVFHQWLASFLEGDQRNPTAGGCGQRLGIGSEPAEALNGAEPVVARGGAYLTCLLYIVEKGHHTVAEIVCQIKYVHGLSGNIGKIAKELHDGVAISGDGVGTEIALTTQPMEEVPNQIAKNGSGCIMFAFHCWTFFPTAFSNRSPMSRNRSGVIVRYTWVAAASTWPRNAERSGSLVITSTPSRNHCSIQWTAKL